MNKKSVSRSLKLITSFLLCVLLLTACTGEGESSQSTENESSALSDSSVEASSENESSEASSEESKASESEKSKDESSESQTSQEASSSEEPSSESEEKALVGIYKGVHNYGIVTSAQKDSFKYVFEVDGKTKRYTIKSDGGKYAIQNTLKRGYEYELTVEGNVLTAVKELTVDPEFTPVVSGTPGEKTVANLLATAMMPVGSTLYIYGGGWDWQDVGSSVQAETIGLSPAWSKFFNSQSTSFTYSNANDKANSYYPHGKWNEYYYAGLDCSGYVGWALYNVAYTESGNEGFVVSAVKMAKTLSDKGWGALKKKIPSTPAAAKGSVLPGDIISKKGHVYMCVGTCDDGSMVILHSTPSNSRTGSPGGGVQLSAVGNSESCQAYELADRYMKTYFPEWYERYTVVLKLFDDYTAFTDNMGVFSWDVSSNSKFMSDPENIRSMSAEQVLEYIFKDVK